jgi:hypothetical protein
MVASPVPEKFPINGSSALTGYNPKVAVVLNTVILGGLIYSILTV